MYRLNFHRLAAMLAVAGACCASTAVLADDFEFDNDFDDTAYVANINPDGGGQLLPPPSYVINAPLAYVDNGYNPNYAWNRGYGYTPYYGPAMYAPLPPGYWAYYARHRAPNWADNAGDYGGGLGTPVAARGYGWHHAHAHGHYKQSTNHGCGCGKPNHWQPAAAQETAPPPPSKPSARRDASGYNGHDRYMFEGPQP